MLRWLGDVALVFAFGVVSGLLYWLMFAFWVAFIVFTKCSCLAWLVGACVLIVLFY